METKNILWNMLISKTDQKNIIKLTKRLKIKSKSEAVRRAVEMALESTEQDRQQEKNENNVES